MWTWPSRGLCSAIAVLATTAVFDAGTFSVAAFDAPFSVAWYSGYIVTAPPRVGSTGIQSSFFSHSVSAVFCPGRKQVRHAMPVGAAVFGKG